MKEKYRKFLVALKRRPQMIALVVLIAGFLVYSLNLTIISNTTAKLQGSNMGLCGFATMLFSILGTVTFLNTFPHRKPVNKIMLALMFLLFGIVIFADVCYMGRVNYALYREVDPIKVTDSTRYITNSLSLLTAHIAITGAGLLLTALLPLYAPLIRKIKTSVQIEGQEMNSIELSGEDA